MKTLTEFAAVTLKNAAQKKQELLAAGKSAEELPAAMGEALTLEGDKLTYLLAALEAVGEKTHELKRVVVIGLNEGETSAPSGSRQIGDKYYAVEYYVPFRKPEPADESRGGRDKGRGGKRGDKRGGRGGEGRGDNRGPRGPRPPRAEASGPIPLPKPLNTPASAVAATPTAEPKAEPKQEA